jgi:hypothetical protein
MFPKITGHPGKSAVIKYTFRELKFHKTNSTKTSFYSSLGATTVYGFWPALKIPSILLYS